MCVAVDVVRGHLLNVPVDGQVIVAGGHDQVGPLYGALLVHFVMVDQHAARRFDDADAFEGIHRGARAYMRVQRCPDPPAAPRFSRRRRALRSAARSGTGTRLRHATEALAEFFQLPSASGVPQAVGDVQPRQRTDAVDALGKPIGL